MDAIVREIEEAFVAHWSLLGGWPGARLVETDGILRYETPIRKLPYNGVIRTAISRDADRVIGKVVDVYAAQDSEFFWLVHPSAGPSDLADRLPAAGLSRVERAHGMSLELEGWEPTAGPANGATLVEVVDEAGLRAYLDLVMAYWEIDRGEREQVERFNRYWFGNRAKGRRWVALHGDRPVGKGYLSLAGPPGVAAIYGMSVRPEARGRGIAGDLTRALVGRAKALGCRRVVLHSSELATGVYRRAGFVERCTLDFYATVPIWSGDH